MHLSFGSTQTCNFESVQISPSSANLVSSDSFIACDKLVKHIIPYFTHGIETKCALVANTTQCNTVSLTKLMVSVETFVETI